MTTLRFRTATLAAACLALGAAGAVGAQGSSVPRVSIPNTELRSLRSRETGRAYDIYVHLPDGYASNTAKRYPVLYVLDGQWDFKLLASVYGGLVYDRFIPEIIVVGITYSDSAGRAPDYGALRVADYSTTAANGGGAPKFLAFLKGELIPFIGTAYRADPSRRALGGSSMGGLFTLYALFAEPRLFDAYIASSPAVLFGDRAAFAREAAFAGRGRELPARLFLSVGSLEELAAPVKEFDRVVRSRGYRGLTMETRVIEGERHSGNKPEAFNRGLRFAFESLASP